MFVRSQTVFICQSHSILKRKQIHQLSFDQVNERNSTDTFVRGKWDRSEKPAWAGISKFFYSTKWKRFGSLFFNMYQLYFDDPRSPTVANTRPKRFSFDPRILKQLNFLRSVDVASLSDSVSLFYAFFISTILFDNLMWLKKYSRIFFIFID